MGEVGYTRGLCVSAQLCCEPKTALKVYFLKKFPFTFLEKIVSL